MKTLARTIVALAAFASAYTFTIAGADATPAPVGLSPEYTWTSTLAAALNGARTVTEDDPAFDCTRDGNGWCGYDRDDVQIGKAISVTVPEVATDRVFDYTPGDPSTPDVANARDAIIYGVPYGTPRALWPAWEEDAETDLRLLSCHLNHGDGIIEASGIVDADVRVADGRCVVVGTIAVDGRSVTA